MFQKALLALLLVPLASPSAGGSLPERESLEYNIEWRLISAGKATLDFRPDAPGEGSRVNLRVESIGFVSKLFRVEDDYTALLNSALCAQSVHSLSQEGSRQRETRITFDSAAHRASYLERDRARNSVVLAKEIETSGCVHDVVGGLYYIRTLNLEPGESTQVPVSDGKKSVMARVESQQREDVRTPAGTFHTIRYEVFLFDNVLYRRSAHLNVWLTDDRRKLPVQIRVRMQFTIGTITLQLEKQT